MPTRGQKIALSRQGETPYNHSKVTRFPRKKILISKVQYEYFSLECPPSSTFILTKIRRPTRTNMSTNFYEISIFVKKYFAMFESAYAVFPSCGRAEFRSKALIILAYPAEIMEGGGATLVRYVMEIRFVFGGEGSGVTGGQVA